MSNISRTKIISCMAVIMLILIIVHIPGHTRSLSGSLLGHKIMP